MDSKGFTLILEPLVRILQRDSGVWLAESYEEQMKDQCGRCSGSPPPALTCPDLGYLLLFHSLCLHESLSLNKQQSDFFSVL